MRVLAIDQSLTSCGFAFMDFNEETTPKVWTFCSKKRDVERLDQIADHVLNEANNLKCDLVLLEDYAKGARGHVFSLGELGGVLRYVLYKNNIQFFIVPIGTHKKYSTGKGNTKKDLMLLSVYKKWGIDTKNNDEADAVSMLYLLKGVFDKMQGKTINNVSVDTLLSCIPTNSMLYSMLLKK